MECTLAKGFSLWEKAWAQVSFFMMGIPGTIGIVLADWPWVFPYVLIFWYGVPGIIMRHTNCPRCPHLHEFDDCLQAPKRLTKWLVKKRKSGPYTPLERSLFYAIFILIPTYPVYWLLSYPWLLAVFALGALAWYGGQFVRFCRRCRVYDCPFNRVAVERRL